MSGPSGRSKKATLHDVAAVAGVSPRTVSRVVNDEDGFSEDTRTRVREVIEQLGYRPNLAARSLVTQRTHTIGLALTALTDPFFPELADAIMRSARDRNRTIFLSQTEDEADLQRDVLDSLLARQVDAIISFPAYGSEAQIRSIAASGVPVVVIDHHIHHPRIGIVRSDIVRGARFAVEHLMGRGHRRIAMLANERSPETRRWRETGFTETMMSAGLEPIIVRTSADYQGGRSAAADLLSKHPDVTAIFAYNDMIGIGVMDWARSVGRKIPDDIAIVGVDDVPMTSLTTPRLSTVRLDRESVGREAVNMAIRMASEPDAVGDETVISVELVVRGSS